MANSQILFAKVEILSDKYGKSVHLVDPFRTKPLTSLQKLGSSPNIIKYVKEINMKAQANDKSWSFHSTHTQDIEWDDIFKSLTRKNPVAIVNIGDKIFCVCVSKQFIRKLNALVEYMDEAAISIYEDFFKNSRPQIPSNTSISGGYMFRMKQQEISKFIKTMKEIRRLEWPKTDRTDAVVTVTLPTI